MNLHNRIEKLEEKTPREENIRPDQVVFVAATETCWTRCECGYQIHRSRLTEACPGCGNAPQAKP